MGATNTTTYYNLSQFIGTDKPAWLQDYNGDMLKIDTAINAAKLAADAASLAAGTAQSTADGAVSSLTTLSATVGTHTTAITNLSGAVNTINSLIGNGTPTTTDQTIIGAINEINSEVGTIETTLNHIYINNNPSDISADSYQATEDCIIYVRAASTNGGLAEAHISSLPVFACYTGGANQIQTSALIPLKNGQTITFAVGTGSNWVARKVYKYV